MPDLKPLYDAILKGNAKTAKETTEQALADGVEPIALVQEWMIPAMAEEIGRASCRERVCLYV